MDFNKNRPAIHGQNQQQLEMSQGNGPMTGMPVWARFISYIGLPGAVALFLIYVFTTNLTADIKSNTAAISGIKIMQEAHNEASSQRADSAAMWLREMTSLLRKVCVNSSKTDAQRQDCLQ